jgi:2-C-methyl-D-erythritol 4-phosphate cytidylyltransferase
METPQVFQTSWLREASAAARARGENPTDDVTVVQAAGCSVQLVASTTPNLKITHAQDLALAASLLSIHGEAADQPRS